MFVDERELAARARQLADELAHGRGRELEVHLARDGAAAELTARAVLRHARTDATVWLDWTALPSSSEDRAAADRGLALLNASRTRLTRALRGGLVIAAPPWAEAACAQGAVDLWSGREFALRPVREPQPDARRSPRSRLRPCGRSCGAVSRRPSSCGRFAKKARRTAALRAQTLADRGSAG